MIKNPVDNDRVLLYIRRTNIISTLIILIHSKERRSYDHYRL